MPAAVTFAAVGVTLYAAHQVGDYWVQTHHQALTKGQPRRAGQLACLRHVATYTATTALFVGVVWWLLDLDVAWYAFAAGQLVSAVTHYWADRRAPLLRLAAHLERPTGKATFAELGTPRPGRDDNPTLGTGAAVLDQAWHHLWLFAAALITALI
jgi:hypothetical protein